MKKILILLVLLSLFLLGCSTEMEDEIAMDAFGQLIGSNTKTTTNDDQATQAPDCANNEFFDGTKCDCKDGYFMQDGKCVPESSKECVFDSDCAPNGVASVCKDKYTKQVYRCDIRTNKCVNGKFRVAETIDCRTDFGANAVCQGGSCLSYNPYNPVAP